ncbi:MAG: hypothetical protein V8Q30_08130 [Acutalibacteraceae bacterium]
MIDLLLEHYSREEMDATFRIMRDWYRLSMEDKMNHRDRLCPSAHDRGLMPVSCPDSFCLL